MTKSNIIDLDVLIVHRTEKAVLVKEHERATGIWFPLSRVEVEGEPGKAGVLSLPESLALEKGLI